jgi:hypothetical protein
MTKRRRGQWLKFGLSQAGLSREEFTIVRTYEQRVNFVARQLARDLERPVRHAASTIAIEFPEADVQQVVEDIMGLATGLIE